jgi:hypothetical protein
MSWTNLLKEKAVDAARWVADNLPTATGYTARRRPAPAGPAGLANVSPGGDTNTINPISALQFGAVPFLVPALFRLRRVSARC